MTTQTACCATTACACRPPSDCDCAAAGVFASVSALNTLTFNADLCINCGMCSAVCPHGVFAGGDRVVNIIRPDACMECGACQQNCPVGALQVNSGVGCAAAMINAALRGLPEPTCGGDTAASCCG